MAKAPEPESSLLIFVSVKTRKYQMFQSVWVDWKGSSRDRHVKNALSTKLLDRVLE